MTAVERAAAAIDRGELVVYPTETVYGLGADALDADATERVYAAKARDRDEPISMGVATVDAALEYVTADERAVAFMREFLPGPVTAVVPAGPAIPEVLTAGRDGVGVRVPDHDLARRFLATAGPVTATSANVSGSASARRVADLDARIRERAAVVLDGGETPGGSSTVVDVATGEVVRSGPADDAVRTWFAD